MIYSLSYVNREGEVFYFWHTDYKTVSLWAEWAERISNVAFWYMWLR
jgi:hypothetical protein